MGVFTLMASIMGCFAAIRMRAAWLCGYIIMVIFVIILQFSFGTAAAALGNIERIPGSMQKIFVEEYKEIDWMYFNAILPEACYAAISTYTTGDSVHFPACHWNATCDISATENMMKVHEVNCCAGVNNICNIEEHPDLCTTPERCLGGLLASIGTPVAIAALFTLFLQFMAIAWACVIRRETVGLLQACLYFVCSQLQSWHRKRIQLQVAGIRISEDYCDPSEHLLSSHSTLFLARAHSFHLRIIDLIISSLSNLLNMHISTHPLLAAKVLYVYCPLAHDLRDDTDRLLCPSVFLPSFMYATRGPVELS